MGVFCKINLVKPVDSIFIPGSTVSGILRYAVDKDTTFKKITLSLKGIGNVLIKDQHRRRKNKRYKYRGSETYVDEDIVILDDQKGRHCPIGSYETDFSFKLPLGIPPTVAYRNKTLRKDIRVVTGVTPRLPREPKIYDKQRKLIQLLRDSLVTIKATINSSVIKSGEEIELVYEIFNETNVNINGVVTKLIEEVTSPKSDLFIKLSDDVVDTDTKTASIKSGDTQTMDVSITVPSDLSSIDNSKLIYKDYYVKIIVEMPIPYRNVVLQIPVQIGNFDIGRDPLEVNERPPSYWEVVEEEKLNDCSDGDDNDNDDDKKEG